MKRDESRGAGAAHHEDHGARKRLAQRWADRVVRVYTAAALQLAGFATSAGALSSLPELKDADSMEEARRRVHAALETVLLAYEVPRSEGALVATFAARAALAVAAHETPETHHLKDLVAALHTGAEVSQTL